MSDPRALDELVRDWIEHHAVRNAEARPCACGGVVIADPADPAWGVQDHQRTDRHQLWSLARGYGR